MNLTTALLPKEECRALEFRYVPNGDVYPLWGFWNASIGTIWTRGRTASEALEWILAFRPGSTWTPLISSPLGAGKFYSETLAAQDCPFAKNNEWLIHPPVWILRQMFGV